MSGLPERGAATVVASDLDRTLIYSANSMMLAESGIADSEAPRLLCVEVYEGAPLSYLSERAAGLLGELAAEAVFVPTTTRTRAQYRRINLPIQQPRYAITTNGGCLLVDGEPDADWARQVRIALRGCAPLAEVQEHLRRTSDPEWLLKLREAEGLFAYLVVERAKLPAGWLADLGEWAAGRGWTVSLQGRKVYLVPGPLSKSAAVAEVRRRVGAGSAGGAGGAGGGRCLAAGDSLLDAEMLAAADLGFRPGHGELADTGWSAPGLVALPEVGVAAGEEILRRLLAEVRADAAGVAAGAGAAAVAAGVGADEDVSRAVGRAEVAARP